MAIDVPPPQVLDCRPLGLPSEETSGIGPSVEVAALASIFSKTTTSYKYVFFLAILEFIRSHPDGANLVIPFDDLFVEVLAIAWYPHTLFHLSFGSKDQLAAALGELSVTDDQLRCSVSPSNHRKLRHHIKTSVAESVRAQLQRYVPFRMLTPFFPSELAGLKDQEKNGAIERLSNALFLERKPLYRIDRDRIEVHPSWCDYIRKNFLLVHAWTAWMWFDYLQARNPAVPAVGKKLFPVFARESLNKQRRYWEMVLEREPLACLYSRRPLTTIEALDHFLPWSFVLHDQIWNLIPACTEANSQKSDSLPIIDHYLRDLVDTQVKGLLVAESTLPKRRWETIAEEFVTGLQLPGDCFTPERLREPELRTTLTRGYERTLPSLVLTASNLGFPQWHYPTRPRGLRLE